MSAPAAAQTDMTAPPELTFERVFASPSLDGASPRQAKLSPDGRYLTLLRNREDDRERYDLWGYDRESGAWTMLVDSEKLGSGRELSEDEKMQRERARVGNLKGIISYQWTPDGSGVLVPLDGDLYLARLDGAVTRLTDTEESELNPALSETGQYVSFVRDRQLWVGEVSQEATPITPKEGDAVRWGEAEFVAQEEMGRLTGYWWSPDDAQIVVQRTDESRVGVVTRAAIGATGTEVFDQRYPVAGSDNAVVELFLMDPDGGNRMPIDLTSNQDATFYNTDDSTDFYIARVDWAPDGSLYVQRQNRQQNWMDVLKVDPATGQTEIALQEEDAMASKGGRGQYWINLSDNYKFLKDGGLIWWSESDGFGHLYLYDASEDLQAYTQLTKGNFVVTKLVGVDEDAQRIYYLATSDDDALEQHVYALDYATSEPPRKLTQDGFQHNATMDQEAQTLLITRSAKDQPPQSYLADTDGQRLAWVQENALDGDHPYAPYLPSHVMPEYGTVLAEDGTPLNWMMLKPEMEPGKQYPVFYYHYSGPGPQVVDRGWDGALAQAIVDKGYIWFALDNRGSANRGVRFEQPLYHAMGGVEVRDQKVGAEYLKSLPFVDADKIALYGWSYGGYMTLKQMQADPGFYAAGISGAPVTRWELYDTHYTERFMGNPNELPEVYEKASAIPDATKITDPLLLIHGMADDNVVFENSSELISVLQEGNVPFEMMLYPGYTHRVSGENISPHMWNTIFRFLERNDITPPE
ncbi:MAG: DPP IV N-terminal domain-containing protein [Pontixanthobacter sp.]